MRSSTLGLRISLDAVSRKTPAEAYFWMNLGASASDEARKAARDQAGGVLTPAKHLEIQARCRKWAETHSTNRNSGSPDEALLLHNDSLESKEASRAEVTVPNGGTAE